MAAPVIIEITAAAAPAEETDADAPVRLFRALMEPASMRARTQASPLYDAEAPTEDKDDADLRRWLELELAAPLRFNVGLTRELLEAQRRSDYLLAENSLLRRRQEERQQLHRELTQCQQRAHAATLDAILTQQHQLLDQQQQLLRSLKTFAVAFQLGGHADNI